MTQKKQYGCPDVTITEIYFDVIVMSGESGFNSDEFDNKTVGGFDL